MKTVCNVSCEVKAHDIMNYCRGIIYVHGYSKEDWEQYAAELKEEFPFIVKVENPAFLKSNNDTTPLLISFATTVPPQSLDIPGEPFLNRVYPFRNKPMLCKKCLNYGHTMKHCKNQQRCRTCTSLSCASLTVDDVSCDSVPKCLHCSGLCDKMSTWKDADRQNVENYKIWNESDFAEFLNKYWYTFFW